MKLSRLNDWHTASDTVGMANHSTTDVVERFATIASLERSQTLLQKTLSEARVPIEEEIRIRLQLADVFIKSFDELQHEQFVHHAVEHLEVVLRKAPRTSSDYPMYLNSLSQARTSEYMITGSLHALDMAVDAAREALEMAIAIDLQSTDYEAQSSIAINLAYALSRRHASSRRLTI